MRGDRLRLLDALDQTDLILDFAKSGQDIFLVDMLVQSAILHRLALLGEAFRGVSLELREAHPEIPWNQVVAFRNIVLHEYFGIDLTLVWAIVAEHIAPLRTGIKLILQSLPEPE